MKQLRTDLLIYLLFAIITSIIATIFHNRNTIRFFIIYYSLFSSMFWTIYTLNIKFNIIKIYFVSLPCLIILEFYFDIFYFDMFGSLGIAGIIEKAFFNYIFLGFFILDLLLLLTRKDIKSNRKPKH